MKIIPPNWRAEWQWVALWVLLWLIFSAMNVIPGLLEKCH